MDDYTMLVYDCGCKYSIDENRKIQSISLCNAHFSIIKLDERKREGYLILAENKVKKNES